MRILILASEIPAPSYRPGSPRLYAFCEEMVKIHELFLYTLRGDAERYSWLQTDPAYAPLFRTVEIIPDPPRKAGWLNRQLHRLTLSPYFLTRHLFPGYSREIGEHVKKLVRENRIDLIYVDCIPMTQYVSPALGVPVISDMHDCLSMLFRKAIGMRRSPIHKLRFLFESRSLAAWERSVARFCFPIILNSPVDEKAIQDAAPLAETLMIPNGVDVGYFKPSGLPTEKNRIVFVGVMSYLPNENAVLYFAEEVFPLVRKKIPDAEFWIVGKDPSEKVRALASQQGVHVTGTVDDVRSYLGSARVFVSPVRYGAGMKNKILNAMAMERPVVSTTFSLDGIAAVPDRDVLVGDTAERFSDQVARVMRDDVLAATLGRNGRVLVQDRYSWEAAIDILKPALSRHEAKRV